jgi:hypothetical protein
MRSAKREAAVACALSAALLWRGAARASKAERRTRNGGEVRERHPAGQERPHEVQPIADRPRFGQPISEADIAAWNIDVRTPDGRGLPAGRGSVEQGKKVYEAKCVACHGADAKGGRCSGRWWAGSAPLPPMHGS